MRSTPEGVNALPLRGAMRYRISTTKMTVITPGRRSTPQGDGQQPRATVANAPFALGYRNIAPSGRGYIITTPPHYPFGTKITIMSFRGEKPALEGFAFAAGGGAHGAPDAERGLAAGRLDAVVGRGGADVDRIAHETDRTVHQADINTARGLLFAEARTEARRAFTEQDGAFGGRIVVKRPSATDPA